MREIRFIGLASLTILLHVVILSQTSDPTLRRIGLHTGNRIGISYYNDGQIAGFNIGTDLRGEWPLGSGENYIGDCIPMIGVEFVNQLGDTLHSVTISRGPRNGQANERHPVSGHFWGWNPVPGYVNTNEKSVAMSHLPNSWPFHGWRDHPDWTDPDGNTQWNGYFGRGITNADQESYYVADDQWDDEFNANFKPDATNAARNGMALTMAVRGFQWSSFLAEDVVFWLYDITNEGSTTYRKTVFGTVVGTLAGGDGDSGDDLGFFDVNDAITYSWDSDNKGNKGQKVGYVGYAFLESPGNPYDGIDNDGDSPNPSSPIFNVTTFDSVVYRAGDNVVLIDSVTYARTLHAVKAPLDTVYSLGIRTIIEAGRTSFREGHIFQIQNGVAIPHPSASNGLDDDLDGLIDENQAVHLETRVRRGYEALKYKNFRTGAGTTDPLIDEKRDDGSGQIISSYQTLPDGSVGLVTHWSGDEDGDWNEAYDDVGSDGVGPEDDGYFGPDPDNTEQNGRPDQGEPNFGRTDPDESDQIGLTSFNFFNNNASPDLSKDEILWSRMTPGRFDIIPPVPQDGDFIYASGFFPLPPSKTERFSISLLFGENYEDILRNKVIVQQIYNAGYKFPQPPKKPKITITEEDGKVVIYWDGEPSERSRDFITKRRDFQGYKIYRATDAGFQDSRTITDALGVLAFDRPIAQLDLKDSVEGFFHPSGPLLTQVGGTTYFLGSNTGITNRFVDSTVIPGQRYYYAVVAYDNGDEALNIFPSENSKFIFRASTGEIIVDDNTGYVTPGRPPIGYTKAQPSTLSKSEPFRGTGTGWVEIIDDKAVRDGNSYRIIFSDSALQGYTSGWSLLDLDSPDTAQIPSTGEILLVRPFESIHVPDDSVIVNGKTVRLDTSVFTATPDTLLQDETLFYGNTTIKHGFRIQLLNHQEIMKDSAKSGFADLASDDAPAFTFSPFVHQPTGPGAAYNGIKMPYDYAVEFHDSIVDTSLADTLFPRTASNTISAKPVTFKIRNLTTGQYIDCVYFKTGTLSTVHNIYFKERINGTVYRTWRVNVYYNVPDAPIEQEGSLTISTAKPFSRTDSFEFTVNGPYIDETRAKGELDLVKVVPNPYVVTHSAEPRLLSTQTSGHGERFIRFTHVPPGSTISIFTVRGELVRKLRHEDLFVGDAQWNLRTEENLDAAYGVYVYVLDAPGIGTKTGKFALIK